MYGLINPNPKYLNENKNLIPEKMQDVLDGKEKFKFKLYNNKNLTEELICKDKRTEQLLIVYAHYRIPVKLIFADNKIISVQNNSNLEKLIISIENNIEYKNILKRKNFLENTLYGVKDVNINITAEYDPKKNKNYER